MRLYFIHIICLFTCLPNLSVAQAGDYFLGYKHYPFIHYNENELLYPAHKNTFEQFYHKIDSIMVYGKGKVNIVHIGGSHIQADIYTHQIRKRLQSLQYDMNGGRGLLFPYRMAKTNNPSNYRVSYTGQWTYSKNTQYKPTTNLGLSGFSVSTGSPRASIFIDPNKDTTTHYSFTKVRVFHSPSNYKLMVVSNGKGHEGSYDSIAGCTVFQLPETNILDLKFIKNTTSPTPITVYGISLDNDDPGIVYNTIGVNGARLSSYLKCSLYGKHMHALQPDLVIFSIGTNDGNTKHFNAPKFRKEYEELIEMTKAAAPNALIMITVPNDCYIYKRYVNSNTAIIRDEIIALAKEKDYAVWDLYSVMGGLDSSKKWYQYGLMQYDRIHFNKPGYLLKGDLFVTALLNGWEKHLSERIVKLTEDKTVHLTAHSGASQSNIE